MTEDKNFPLYWILVIWFVLLFSQCDCSEVALLSPKTRRARRVSNTDDCRAPAILDESILLPSGKWFDNKALSVQCVVIFFLHRLRYLCTLSRGWSFFKEKNKQHYLAVTREFNAVARGRQLRVAMYCNAHPKYSPVFSNAPKYSLVLAPRTNGWFEKFRIVQLPKL